MLRIAEIQQLEKTTHDFPGNRAKTPNPPDQLTNQPSEIPFHSSPHGTPVFPGFQLGAPGGVTIRTVRREPTHQNGISAKRRVAESAEESAGFHHVMVPNHRPLKTGTLLGGILKPVASHHKITIEELLARLKL